MPFFCFRLIVFIIDEVNLFSFRQPMYSQNRLLFPPSSSSHMWLGDYIPVDLNSMRIFKKLFVFLNNFVILHFVPRVKKNEN